MSAQATLEELSARGERKPWPGKLGAAYDPTIGQAAARAEAIDLLSTLQAPAGR